MASKLGSVFVELNLDDKVYKQKLSDQLTSTQTTAKGIETSWRALGVKSSEYFDQQRRAAQNAYTLIKSSATSTANDIVRAEKAKNDRITALNQQQFGKQTSLLTQIKNHWLGLAATATMFIATMNKLTDAFMQQEDAELKLAQAMGNAGNYTRENFKAMKDYASQLQQVTKYGDEVTLATMANLQTYGMDIEALQRATKATQDLASAKGIDLRAAADLVGKAFVGETGSLSRYGIVLDEGIPKTQKFAAVLKLIEDRFGGTAQAELETYAGQWKQISNWWGDRMETAGLVVLKTLEAVQMAFGLVGTAFYSVLESAFSALADFVGLAEKIPIIGSKFTGFRKELEFIAGNFTDAKEAALGFTNKNYEMLKSFDQVQKYAEKSFGNTTKVIKTTASESASATKQITESIRKLQVELNSYGLDNYQKALIRIESEKKEWEKKEANKAEITKWYLLEIQKAETDYYIEKAKEAINIGSQLVSEENKLRVEGWNALAEKHKQINEAMTAEEKYSLEQRTNQYKEAWDNMVSIANLNSGNLSLGMGQYMSGMKGLSDISTGQDQYSKEIDAALEHYQQMEEMYMFHQDRINILTQAAAERDLIIQYATNKQKISSQLMYAQIAMGTLNAISEFTDKENKAMFIAMKAVSIAMAIIQGHLAAMGAAAAVAGVPYVGPVLAAQQYSQWMALTYVNAGLMAAVAIGQLSGMGSSSASVPTSSYTASSTGYTYDTESQQTKSTEEAQKQVSINLHVYGNIVNYDEFAREVVPSITKAIADGVH